MDNFFQKLPKFKACCGIWLIVILAIILTPILNKLEIDLTLIGGAFTGLITFCAMIFIEEKQKERWQKEAFYKNYCEKILLVEKCIDKFISYTELSSIRVIKSFITENYNQEITVFKKHFLPFFENCHTLFNTLNYLKNNHNTENESFERIYDIFNTLIPAELELANGKIMETKTIEKRQKTIREKIYKVFPPDNENKNKDRHEKIQNSIDKAANELKNYKIKEIIKFN